MKPDTHPELFKILSSIDLSLREIATEMMKRPAASSAPAGTAQASQSSIPVHAFTGWKAACLPSWAKFGGGEPLGFQTQKSLDFWFNWQPKPFGDRPPSSADVAFRKALDQAKADIESGAWIPPVTGVRRSSSSGSSATRKPKPVDEAPKQWTTGEDEVPFD